MATEDLAKLFVDRYFDHGCNATEAILSIRPKLSRPSAKTEGWRMLTSVAVKAMIREREILERAKSRMTVQQFGDLLLEAATVDVLDFYNEDGRLKPLSEIPPNARRQIASIEPVELEYWEKGKVKREIGYKIKLWDIRKAQELWGKWKKMFTDKTEISGADGGPLRVSVSINGTKK